MKGMAIHRSSDRAVDYYDWLCSQATALKTSRPQFLDWEKLAEELEEMGARERRELVSHLRILMAHLLKWTYQGTRRSTSWKRTILLARQDATAVLQDSPSLKRMLGDFIEKAYEDARRLAGTEMKLDRNPWGRLFPEVCPLTLTQLLDPDFLPKAARADYGR
jgi:hypothetical protein